MWVRRVACVVAITVLIGMCTWIRFEIQEQEKYREELENFAQWDEYGTVPLMAAVTGNREIYDFNSYIGDNWLTYELFYRSADAEDELKQYGEYLLSKGYTDMTPASKDNILVAEYWKENPDWNDHTIRVTALRNGTGFELRLSGF